MTREEAVQWFKNNPFYHEEHEPFQMAIRALQEPQIVRCVNCKFCEKKAFFETVHYCKWGGLQVDDNFFCANGEKPEEV